MTMYDNNIIWYNTAWWQLYMIYYIKITMSYGKKGMMTILYDTIIYDENVKWNNNLWWHDYMKQCYMMTKLQISKIPVLHLAVSSFLMLLTVSSPVCPMTSVCVYPVWIQSTQSESRLWRKSHPWLDTVQIAGMLRDFQSLMVCVTDQDLVLD